MTLSPSSSPECRRNIRFACFAAFIGLSLASITADGQAASQSTTPFISEKGAEFYELTLAGRNAATQHDYRKAAELFEKALALSQEDPGLYVELGNALFSLKEYERAAKDYETARRYGFYERARSAEKIAACYALSGNKQAALDWLEEALRSRAKERPNIAQDARFASLQNEPRFKGIVGALQDGIQSRAQGWNYDLDFLVSEIHRLNPVYQKDLPPEFERKTLALRQKLGTLTDEEIALEIMGLFATLHEAHTVMAPFGMRRGVLGLIPIQLYSFSDGLFVVDAARPNQDLIGSRVLAIGGIDPSSLSARIQPYIARDNDQFLPFAVPIGLTWPDLLRAVGATVAKDSIEMKFNKQGLEQKRTIQTLSAIDPDKLPMKLIAPKGQSATPPDYLSHLDHNFWLTPVDDSTLYIQFNQFVNETSKTLDEFAEDIDHTIKVRGPRNVVVDVRLNNGGDYSSTFPILKALFRFETSRPDARLYVITGRNTLSAAQNFISTLDEFGGVIFVGEPSGSKPNHVGDDTFVVLPYSGIIGSIACALHQTEFRDEREWIAPNIPVALSSHAYFSQHDPAMDAIKEVIKHN